MSNRPNKPGHRVLLLGAALAVVPTSDSAAGEATAGTDGTLVIGSKNFTENRLLSEIAAQFVEAHTKLKVQRRINLGGTTIVFSALQSGQIDMYPEYTGTGWTIHLDRSDRAGDPLRTYLHVADEFQKRYGMTWLRPFGFSNSYALAMDETLAEKLGVRVISDLKRHQERLRAGLSHEFLDRGDGFPGLARTYGLEIGDLRGMEHGLAYEAINTQRIDLIDTWTTDGKLTRYNIRILQDDKRFFPPYDCALLVSDAALRRHPGLRDLLNRLAFSIDDEKMRKLNARVEEEGGSFEEVAHDFLAAEGLLKAGRSHTDATIVQGRADREGFLAFMWQRRGETAGLVAQHLGLTALAVLLAIVFAVPLGLVLTRKPRLASTILGAAGAIQTVPSLALLAFMIPIPGLGLGARSAVAALFLYALLPILRNTITGIQGLDPDLIEAARGIGLRDRQILLKVQLPLATRTIMAGIRTSTVISIGIATLGAFIGAGGLGDPIVTGLQLNDINLILSGAVPAATLALIADFALGMAERLLVPRGL